MWPECVYRVNNPLAYFTTDWLNTSKHTDGFRAKETFLLLFIGGNRGKMAIMTLKNVILPPKANIITQRDDDAGDMKFSAVFFL